VAELFELRISTRESYLVQIVEVCKPRSKHDQETHRVQLLGGGIVRVCESQLKPWPKRQEQVRQ
jgi:hypothetical protein